jgi:hypothetical protein
MLFRTEEEDDRPTTSSPPGHRKGRPPAFPASPATSPLRAEKEEEEDKPGLFKRVIMRVAKHISMINDRNKRQRIHNVRQPQVSQSGQPAFPMADSMQTQTPREVKSEHCSPLLSPASNLDQLNGLLPPLDLSNLSGDYNFMQNLDGFSAIPDQEPPMFSAGLSSTSINWSHYDDLDFNNDNFAASSYSQAPSFTGFDFSSIDQPALTTTSTLGEISEVKDFGSLNDTSASRSTVLNNQYGSDFDPLELVSEIDRYRLSTASSYIRMPQAQMLASNNVEAINIFAFLKGVTTSNGYSTANHGLLRSNYTDNSKIGQNLSQFDSNTNFPLLSTNEGNDAFWMTSFISSNLPVNNSHRDIPEENFWAE